MIGVAEQGDRAGDGVDGELVGIGTGEAEGHAGADVGAVVGGGGVDHLAGTAVFIESGRSATGGDGRCDLVEVVDREGEGLRLAGAIGTGGGDLDIHAGTEGFTVDGGGDGDHTGGGIDGKQAAGIAGQAVGDGIGGGVGVAGKGGDADQGADGDVLVDGIGGGVGVGRGSDIELVDIVDGDGEGLLVEGIAIGDAHHHFIGVVAVAVARVFPVGRVDKRQGAGVGIYGEESCIGATDYGVGQQRTDVRVTGRHCGDHSGVFVDGQSRRAATPVGGDGGAVVLHTEEVGVAQVLETVEFDHQIGLAVAVGIGLDVGGILPGVLFVPDTVDQGSGASPLEVGGTQQRTQVDLVVVRVGVTHTGKVTDSIHPATIGFHRALVDEEVIAAAAAQQIGAIAALDGIVTAFTVDGVVAVAGIDRVVAATCMAIAVVAIDDLRAIAAVDGVAAGDGSALLPVVIPAVAVDDVVTVLAVDERCPDDVVAGSTIDEVLAVAAGEDIVPEPAVEGILAVAAQQGVAPAAAVENVTAIASIYEVGSCAANERVVFIGAADVSHGSAPSESGKMIRYGDKIAVLAICSCTA
ncbi:hypothetical protein D3C75_430970 [compost metagenome]